MNKTYPAQLTGVALMVVGLLTLAPACSGPASRVLTASTDAQEPASFQESEEEDFDVDPYREVPPPARVVIVHDAPEYLLRGKAGEGRSATRHGYRIQILSARSKAEADFMSAQAIQWWEEEREKGDLALIKPTAEGAPPVYQDFSEPYWRVRVGNFSERSRAQEILPFIQEIFAGAFIAPSQIPMLEE